TSGAFLPILVTFCGSGETSVLAVGFAVPLATRTSRNVALEHQLITVTVDRHDVFGNVRSRLYLLAQLQNEVVDSAVGRVGAIPHPIQNLIAAHGVPRALV